MSAWRRAGSARGPLIVGVAAALVLAGAVTGLLLLLLGGSGGPPDYSGRGTGSAVVQVREGASVAAIGTRLDRSGVVKSSAAFVQAAQNHPQGTSIQPGHYRLRQRMEASQALALMLSPKSRVQARVTVSEGMRMSEIFTHVAKRTDLTEKALRKAAKEPQALGVPAYAETLEGYLFPATYTVEPDETAQDLLRRMVTEFESQASQLSLKQRAGRRDMTPHQIVTVASLVQAEAKRAQDFPKVAAVVYNRLDEGMRLELDPTVNYVTGDETLQVSKQDTKVDSPYNTYKYPGLPPGPINSPGARALRAALNPAGGDWLYFVTTDPDTGTTKFTSNYQEFLQLKKRFKRNTQSGGG